MPGTAAELQGIAGVRAGMRTQKVGCWVLVSPRPCLHGDISPTGICGFSSEKRGLHCAKRLKVFGKAQLAAG